MTNRARRNKKKKAAASKSNCATCDYPDNDWMILCDFCEKWYHFNCVQLTEAPSSEFWKCPTCREMDRRATGVVPSIPPQDQTASIPHQDRIPSIPPQVVAPLPPYQAPPIDPQTEIEKYIPVTPPQRQTQQHPQGAVSKDPNRHTRRLEFEQTPVYPEGIRVHHSTSVQRSSCSTTTDRRTQIELKRLEEEEFLMQKLQQEQYLVKQRFLDRKYDILLKGSERGSLNAELNRTATEEWVKRTIEFTGDDDAKNRSSEEIDLDDFTRRLNALKMTPTAAELATVHQCPVPEAVGIPKKSSKEAEFQRELPLQRIKSSSPKIGEREKEVQINPTARSWDKGNIDGLSSDSGLSAQFRSGSSKEKLHASKGVTSSNVIASSGKNRSPHSSHVLTRDQIASRHVVTRDLPFFNGNPEDWLIFQKRYINSTKLCGYSDGENLDRLQKCLKGDAYDAVRDLLLDVESVADIMAILETLFGRPELIVKRLLKKLRLLPNPKSDNLQSMVKFALDVQYFAKTVERKALSQYLSNPLLMEELVERLPTTFKVDWAKYIVNIPDDRITLITLSEWLYKLMKALIKVTEYSPKESPKNERKQNKSSSERVNLHQDDKSSDKIKQAESQKSSENKCSICNKGCSAVESCSIFTSLQPAQRWKAMYDNKLCRKCLKKHNGFCKTDKACGVNGCIYKHHSLLHDDQKHKPSQPKSSSKDVVRADISGSHLSINAKVILRIIPIKIYGNGITLDTFAFLDDGSTATLIDRTLADALKLTGVPKDLCLIWSSNIHRREKNSRQFSVSISSTDNSNTQFKLREVRTVELLGIPSQRLNKEELCDKFPYLKQVPFANYENAVPGILIGCNNPRIGISREVVDSGDYQPVAARTLIGWTVHGPVSKLE